MESCSCTLVPGLLILTCLGYITSTASCLWHARDIHLIFSATQTLYVLTGVVHSCLLYIKQNGKSDIGVNNNGDIEKIATTTTTMMTTTNCEICNSALF